MSGDPLDQLIAMVDPRGCQLENLPSRVWVFGGQSNPDPNAAPSSLRDSFWRQSLTVSREFPWLKDLERPEDHPGWWAFSGYDDLLEFERDACYLARGTILFAESPGSHAELGALAIDDSILSRLLVVVESKHLQEDQRQSFLNLGPLRRVERQGCRCVVDAAVGRAISDVDFDVISDSISSWLPTVPTSSVLHVSNPTHRLLLLADLVDLLLVSKLVDLERAMAHFGIQMSGDEIRRSLTLLDFFGLVKLDHLGYEPFGVRRRSSHGPWINYTRIGSHRFDRSRFKVGCLRWIEKNQRRNAIFERHQ